MTRWTADNSDFVPTNQTHVDKFLSTIGDTVNARVAHLDISKQEYEIGTGNRRLPPRMFHSYGQGLPA